MDWTAIAALLTAVSAIVWMGWDKAQAAKASNSQYADSLAQTAERLVNVAQDVYRDQITDLKTELTELRQRVANLEIKLHAYQQCPAKDCPMRGKVNGAPR